MSRPASRAGAGTPGKARTVGRWQFLKLAGAALLAGVLAGTTQPVAARGRPVKLTPTGVAVTDSAVLQNAAHVGGSYLLKATNASGAPTPWNIGINVIVVDSPADVVFSGEDGSTIDGWLTNRPPVNQAIRVDSAARFALENLTINSYSSVIMVSRTGGLTVRNCTIKGRSASPGLSQGIFFASTTDSPEPIPVEIRGSRFTTDDLTKGFTAIQWNLGTYKHHYDAKVVGNDLYGYVIMRDLSGHYKVEDNQIVNGNVAVQYLTAAVLPFLHPGSTFSIKRNHIESRTLSMTYGIACGTMIHDFAQTRSVEIVDNTIVWPDSGNVMVSGAGIMLHACNPIEGATIADNTLSGKMLSGIWLADASDTWNVHNCRISGNDLSDTKAFSAQLIIDPGAGDCTVGPNNFFGDVLGGIRAADNKYYPPLAGMLVKGDNNVIRNNRCVGSTYTGWTGAFDDATQEPVGLGCVWFAQTDAAWNIPSAGPVGPFSSEGNEVVGLKVNGPPHGRNVCGQVFDQTGENTVRGHKGCAGK